LKFIKPIFLKSHFNFALEITIITVKEHMSNIIWRG